MKSIPLVQMSDAAESLYMHIAWYLHMAIQQLSLENWNVENWVENGNKCQEMPHLIKYILSRYLKI